MKVNIPGAYSGPCLTSMMEFLTACSRSHVQLYIVQIKNVQHKTLNLILSSYPLFREGFYYNHVGIDNSLNWIVETSFISFKKCIILT